MNRRSRKAFSLIEIMAVISIMSMLTGLLMLSLNGIRGSSKLNYSGNQVVNLINLARQNSMSKNVLTALVVMKDPSQTQASQAIILMELTPRTDGTTPASTDWKPISKWETINNGSIVDKLVSFETEQPQPEFPALKYGAADAASTYDYIIFLPGGNLLSNSSTSQIRLTEGFFPKDSAAPVFTRPAPDGQPANTYNITILGATGRTKIDRS